MRCLHNIDIEFMCWYMHLRLWTMECNHKYAYCILQGISVTDREGERELSMCAKIDTYYSCIAPSPQNLQQGYVVHSERPKNKIMSA